MQLNGIDHPRSPLCVFERPKNDSGLRFAYLVAVNGDSNLFENLFRNIFRERHVYAIYLSADLSAQGVAHVTSVVKDRANVVVLSEKFQSNSEGVGLVITDLAALLALLPMGPWDYFINLSENDFPIKKDYEVTSMLMEESPQLDRNFIGISLKQTPNVIWRNSCPVGKEPLVPVTGDIYTSSPLVVLSRSFCEYLSLSPQAKTLVSYLDTIKNIPPSDSYFYGTILKSSEEFSSTGHDKDWHFVGKGRPKERLWEKDLLAFSKMRQLFARKFLETDIQLLVERGLL